MNRSRQLTALSRHFPQTPNARIFSRSLTSLGGLGDQGNILLIYF